MYQATNGFINTLRWGAPLVAAQITTLNKGVNTQIVVPVSVAQFTVDRNAAQRRSGEMTVEIQPNATAMLNGVAQPFPPISPSSPLSPFGNEVSVQLTVYGQTPTASGMTQTTLGQNGWVPMGTYAIASTTIDDAGIDWTITLDLYDRSWIFSRWALLNNYNVPASTGHLQDEIVALLSSVWNNNGPGRASQVGGARAVPTWITNPNISTNSYVVPAGVYQQGQDPWQACLDMAAGAGFELFFDVNGTLTGTPAPGSPASNKKLSQLPVVWGFNPGEVTAVGTFQHALGGTPYTTPVAASLQMTRDKIYNDYWVAAIGPSNATGGNTPQQAEAFDNNPQSPTYINSEIGDIPYFVYDSNISTQAQALVEAQYDLAVSISNSWTVSVTSPMNPLFDIDDVCTITNPRWSMTDQKFVIDSIHTSVRYDEQTVVTGRIIQPGS